MTLPDYYQILGVNETATHEEIRLAYMRKALNTHPDRNQSPDATQEFQKLADAYYTLGDTTRRKEYDNARRQHRNSTYSRETHADANDVFGDVFEDMLQSEVGSSGNSNGLWSILGLASGAVLGFVVANLPGALVGSFAGKKLGAVRDRTGRPAYHVFQELPHARKLQVLAALAARFITTNIPK